MRETPRPKYQHSHDKRRCKVCRAQLIQPKKPRPNAPVTVQLMLFNRGLCGAACLFDDYEDLDRLTDELYEALDDVQGELTDCLKGIGREEDLWKA